MRALALLVAVLAIAPVALFWAAVLVAALRTAALWTLMLVRVLPAGRPSWRSWRRQLAYALPFGGAMLFYISQRYCAQYLVSARFAPAEFALFTIAAFHMPILTIVFTSTSEVLMVRMTRSLASDPRRALAEWQDAVGKLAFILFPAACVSWLVGAALVPWLFTVRYARAVPLFMLATFEFPVWIVPTDALLRTGNDTRFIFTCNVVRVFVTVALVLVGLRLYGMGGAIVATTASEALARLVFLARGRRLLAARWSELLHVEALAPCAAACAIASAIGWSVSRSCSSVPMRVIGPALVFGAIYLGLSKAYASRRARRHVAVPLPST